MKRCISVIVVLACVISFFSVLEKAEPAKAITKFTMKVNPSSTNVIATYTFRFSIEKTIQVHDIIKLVFPPGTTFTPPLPEEQEARKARLVQLMNCIQYIPPSESWKDPEPGIALIDCEKDGSITLIFRSHFEFNPEQSAYRDLVVTVSQEAGIVTPSLSGAYRYKVATSAEPTFAESQTVEISDASFTASIFPPMISTIAEFEFQIPLRKTIKVHDWFCLVFPPGTTLTPPLPEGEKALQYRLKDIVDAFSLSGVGFEACLGLPQITFQNDGSMELKLHSPIELDPAKPEYKNIRIKFSRKAGFTTPPTPGKIQFSFYTIRDLSLIRSQEVELLNLTKFRIEIDPPVAGEVAEFSYYFRFEKPIKVQDWIKIKLPPGTTLNPPLPEEEKARKERLRKITEAINFDNGSCDEIQILPMITVLSDGSMEIQFNNHVNINPDDQRYVNTMIVFSKEAGIVNPSVPGSYQYSIASKYEPDYVSSQPVEIMDKTAFQVTVCPKLTGKVATYRFYIKLNKVLGTHEWFQLTFPPGTTLTPPLPEDEHERKLRLRSIAEAFTIDQKSCADCQGLPILTFQKDGSFIIKVSSPFGMGPYQNTYQETIIEIDASAGITNPTTPGPVSYFFKNQQETGLKGSKPIELVAQKLKVEVNPTSVGSVARYQFVYIAEKKMEMHQWISFYFPPGTTLNPPLPDDEQGKKERLREIGSSIEYDLGEESNPIPILETKEDGSLNLRISSTLVFDPMDRHYRETVITITEKAGICLPHNPGKYLYHLSFQNEPNKTASQPVEVTRSTTTPAEVSLSHPFVGEPTGLDIRFQLGASGDLRFTEHYFHISFPESFRCALSAFLSDQPEYRFEMISINQIPLLTKPSWTGSVLTLPVLQDMKPSDTVWIHIDPKYGFINPYEAGEKFIFVSTSTEQEKVQSQPFVIKTSEYSARASINPAKTAKNAWITLSYYNHQDVLKADDIIAVTFPDGFYMPGPICCGAGVTIQGDPTIKLNFVGQTMEIASPVAIELNTLVKIEIGPGTAIETPKQPGLYTFKIEHTRYKTLFVSNPVKIEEPKLEIQQIDLSKPNCGEIVDYAIHVAFHPDRIPKIGELLQIEMSFLEKPIQWIVEEEFSEKVILTLRDIQNPSPGLYQVSVEYGSEKTEFADKIMILPPLPSVSYQLIGGKQGKNGWLTKAPLISFVSNGPNSQIFYGYDMMNIALRYYDKPELLSPGYYLMDIFCFAKSPYGKSAILTIHLKIDTIQPELSVLSPKEKKVITSQNQFTISGQVAGIKFENYNQDTFQILYDQNLTISGKSISVNPKTGAFKTVWELQEGQNLLLFRLEDEAGNELQQEYEIVLDTTPPVIKLDSPLLDHVWLSDTLTISGYAGYNDPAAYLTINEQPVYPNPLGHFEYRIALDKLGSYPIVVIAKDALENTTEMQFTIWFGYSIELTIGDKKAVVNQHTLNLTTSPLIQNGRTLVPFRFIGEAIEIPVSYRTDPLTKKVTHVFYHSPDIKIELMIGNRMALVNGKSIQMEVPPQIIEGSTMIPLRFVTENLGFHLEWNPADQTIHLQYPGKFAGTGQ
ncbi:copper amine oxidase N-terminal domain-containing protein [bacterium]|nr:copper amine oxidase N-terminal domain-containing protein [bacterium]